jgi:hypothetical protein
MHATMPQVPSSRDLHRGTTRAFQLDSRNARPRLVRSSGNCVDVILEAVMTNVGNPACEPFNSTVAAMIRRSAIQPTSKPSNWAATSSSTDAVTENSELGDGVHKWLGLSIDIQADRHRVVQHHLKGAQNKQNHSVNVLRLVIDWICKFVMIEVNIVLEPN